MTPRKFFATICTIVFLASCSTLNMDLDSIADEIGDQQRRDQCIKEYKLPCPEEQFPLAG